MLHIEIYYKHAQLSSFINNALLPIINKATTDHTIDTWFITLSNYRGEHIKLMILPTVADDNEVKKYFVNEIKRLLLTYPSKSAPVSYPIDSVFMHFDNNSLFAYWSKLAHLDKEVIKSKAIHNQIAQTLFKHFSNKIANQSSLFTLLIYIQLVAFKVGFQASSANEIKKAINRIKKARRKKEDLNANNLVDIFQNNETVLTHMALDVYSNKKSKKLTFIKDWESCCIAFFQADNRPFEKKFDAISKAICDDLSLYEFQSPTFILEIIKILECSNLI